MNDKLITDKNLGRFYDDLVNKDITELDDKIVGLDGKISNLIKDTATSSNSTWSSTKINSTINSKTSSLIKDTTTANNSTWSSTKINSEIQAHSGETYYAGDNINIDSENVISAIFNVATTAEIQALFAEPVPPTQPNDEIWYTTSNNEAITIDPEYIEDYFDKPMLSNTYSDGKGIIKFDGDLTSIEDIFYNITENCDALTSISIPESVTNLAYGSYLFSGCSSLTTVKLPATYEGGIGELFFSGCENLETVIIPEGTTYIGDGAFGGCVSLTTITIPSNVTNLGPSAFDNCESLTSVTCEPTTPPYAGGSMFENTNDCPIYVPAESVNAYKTAEGWTKYAGRIQAIQ